MMINDACEYDTDRESPKTGETAEAAKAVVGETFETVKTAGADRKRRRAPRKINVHKGNEGNAFVLQLSAKLRAGPPSNEEWVKANNELLEQPAGAKDVLGVAITFKMDGKKLEKVVIVFLGRTVEVQPTKIMKGDGTSEHGFSIATLGIEVGKILGVDMPSLLKWCEFRNVGADMNLFNGRLTKRVVHLAELLHCFECGEIEQKKGGLRSSSVTLFGHTVSLCADCAKCGVVVEVCGNKFACKAEGRAVQVEHADGDAVLVDNNWTNSEEEAAAGESDSDDDKPLVPPPTKNAAKPEKPDTPKKAKSPTIIIGDDSEDEASAPVAMVVDDASSAASAASAVSESSVASSAAAASESSTVEQVEGSSEPAEEAKSARKRKKPEEKSGETGETGEAGLMEEGSSAASAAPAKKEKKEKKEKSGSSAASRPGSVCAAERVYTVTETQLKACYEELGDVIPHNLFGRVKEIIKKHLL